MSKTITSLQEAVAKEDQRIDQAHERLSELSIQVSVSWHTSNIAAY